MIRKAIELVGSKLGNDLDAGDNVIENIRGLGSGEHIVICESDDNLQEVVDNAPSESRIYIEPGTYQGPIDAGELSGSGFALIGLAPINLGRHNEVVVEVTNDAGIKNFIEVRRISIKQTVNDGNTYNGIEGCNTVVGCNLSSISGDGIYFDGNNGRFYRNHYNTNGGSGIHLGPNSKKCIVKDNHNNGPGQSDEGSANIVTDNI